MNKIIFTEDRLFMTVVGPSGCGKTRLIFNMLLSNTFYPNFEKIYYFYQQSQSLFREMEKKLPNIKFLHTINFNLIDKLENALLIFDDSCEELYAERRFAKLATSGRHKKIAIIYVKHNLYHQSKQSKTIDLQNTHIVLFKNIRDVGQIVYLGRQLVIDKFLIDCYKRATSEPHGHLLLDFDSQTSEGLRFCSNIVGPLPTIFYLTPEQAVEPPGINEREGVAYSSTLLQAKTSPQKVFYNPL